MAFDVSPVHHREQRGFTAKFTSTKETDCHTGDGGYNQEEDHHGNRAVLVFVIQSGAKKAVSLNGFNQTLGFFKLRRLPAWNAFTFSHFTAHGPWRQVGVIAIAHP